MTSPPRSPWLVEQHRPEDAAPLIDAARTTSTEIGATGWLSRLDSWHSSREPAPTLTAGYRISIYFHRKWTNTRPKFFESFSTRW